MRYVAETKNSILTRMWSHRSTVRKGTQWKGHLGSHFRRQGLKNLKIFGLEHNPGWPNKDRLCRERFCIRKLDMGTVSICD